MVAVAQHRLVGRFKTELARLIDVNESTFNTWCRNEQIITLARIQYSLLLEFKILQLSLVKHSFLDASLNQTMVATAGVLKASSWSGTNASAVFLIIHVKKYV